MIFIKNYKTEYLWKIIIMIKHLKNLIIIVKNKIRTMIINTLKRVLESQLSLYYFEIWFSTVDMQNSYKLPIIGYLANDVEAGMVYRNIFYSLNDNFNITSVKEWEKDFDLDIKIKEIETSQQVNGWHSIRVLLERIKYENGCKIISSKHLDENLDFKVNVIGKERVPFTLIQDLFVIKINEAILKDQIK